MYYVTFPGHVITAEWLHSICVDINSSSSEVKSMLATIPCTRQGSTVTMEQKLQFPPVYRVLKCKI